MRGDESDDTENHDQRSQRMEGSREQSAHIILRESELSGYAVGL
jgi:hypothetical protein